MVVEAGFTESHSRQIVIAAIIMDPPNRRGDPAHNGPSREAIMETKIRIAELAKEATCEASALLLRLKPLALR